MYGQEYGVGHEVQTWLNTIDGEDISQRMVGASSLPDTPEASTINICGLTNATLNAPLSLVCTESFT